MKNLKKSMALVAAIAMSASMLAGCETGGTTETTTAAGGDTAAPAVTEAATLATAAETQPEAEALVTDGKVLTCYSWNNEFQGFMDEYYLVDKPLSGVTVNWVITPGTADYQTKLDGDLTADAGAAEKIDLFLGEFDYMAKYVDTPFSKPVTALGITTDELADQFPYALSAGLSPDGTYKALSFQTTPMLIAYRRSMAKEVLGSDDPAVVGEALKDWAAVEATAEKMKAAGKKLISDYDEFFRTYADAAGEPCVALGSTTLVVPKAWEQWVDATKKYTDAGYINGTSIWSAEWTADMAGDTVFLYQGPAWQIDFNIKPNTKDTYGDWGVTTGPVNTFWGGTWIFAGANTDNGDIVADIMRYFTTDDATIEKWARGTGNFPVDQSVAAKLAADTSYGNDFLGGQNAYPLYAEVAAAINGADVTKQLSKYGALCEKYQGAYLPYFLGTTTKEQALEDFYTASFDLYPELTRG
jgi:hypothetical protein